MGTYEVRRLANNDKVIICDTGPPQSFIAKPSPSQLSLSTPRCRFHKQRNALHQWLPVGLKLAAELWCETAGGAKPLLNITLLASMRCETSVHVVRNLRPCGAKPLRKECATKGSETAGSDTHGGSRKGDKFLNFGEILVEGIRVPILL